MRLAQSVAQNALDYSPNSFSSSSFVTEHPLNAFYLIQRFRTIWQLIDELMLNTDALFQGKHSVTLVVVLKCLIFFQTLC